MVQCIEVLASAPCIAIVTDGLHSMLCFFGQSVGDAGAAGGSGAAAVSMNMFGSILELDDWSFGSLRSPGCPPAHDATFFGNRISLTLYVHRGRIKTPGHKFLPLITGTKPLNDQPDVLSLLKQPCLLHLFERVLPVVPSSMTKRAVLPGCPTSVVNCSGDTGERLLWMFKKLPPVVRVAVQTGAGASSRHVDDDDERDPALLYLAPWVKEDRAQDEVDLGELQKNADACLSPILDGCSTQDGGMLGADQGRHVAMNEQEWGNFGVHEGMQQDVGDATVDDRFQTRKRTKLAELLPVVAAAAEDATIVPLCDPSVQAEAVPAPLPQYEAGAEPVLSTATARIHAAMKQKLRVKLALMQSRPALVDEGDIDASSYSASQAVLLPEQEGAAAGDEIAETDPELQQQAEEHHAPLLLPPASAIAFAAPPLDEQAASIGPVQQQTQTAPTAAVRGWHFAGAQVVGQDAATLQKLLDVTRVGLKPM